MKISENNEEEKSKSRKTSFIMSPKFGSSKQQSQDDFRRKSLESVHSKNSKSHGGKSWNLRPAIERSQRQKSYKRLLIAQNSVANLTPEEDDEIELTKLDTFRYNTYVFLEWRGTQGLMAVLTIYALFGDDLRLIFFPKDADEAFTMMSSIAFFAFIIEMMLSSFAKPGYFPWPPPWKRRNLTLKKFHKFFHIGSFYLWLDLIATASLIFEISWIYDTGSTTQQLSGSDSGLQTARAGRASRAGARAGRIVRIVRMVRLVRLVKLYKLWKERLKEEALTNPQRRGSQADLNLNNQLNDDVRIPKQSRVGAMLSDLTTRRVIVGVLAMLMIIPLLYFDATDTSVLLGLDVVHGFSLALLEGTADEAALEFSIQRFINQTDDLLKLTVDGAVLYYLESKYNSRRSTEIELYEVSETDQDFISVASLDIKAETEEVAALGICLTLLVISLLAFGSMLFIKDVQKLVIMPIEAMVDLVKKIRDNPLGFDYKSADEFQAGMETTQLLNTINKIGGLMRVGFGEAGASIIARNLEMGDSTHQEGLNLLSSGFEIKSIFGFCDIRNFTDTTECLQEEVMLFVNRIASVLHGVVSQCRGAANKNIGDAFLLTWKLEEEMAPADMCDVADQALYSFVRTIAEMSRHQHFFLSFSLAATHRLFQRMPGYKVKMGFGLHYGWAIEGAIGSNMKIDASYISPHVNMSEFLESSTKEYGVCLLMSEAFYNLMSDEAKYHCRMVDCIKKRKSEEPFGLYTYDMDPDVSFYIPDAARQRATMSQEAVEAIALRFARRFSSALGRNFERSKDHSNAILPGPVTQQPVRPLDPDAEERSTEERPRKQRFSQVLDAAVLASKNEGLKRRLKIKSKDTEASNQELDEHSNRFPERSVSRRSPMSPPLFGQQHSTYSYNLAALERKKVEPSGSRGSLVLDIGKGTPSSSCASSDKVMRKRANGRAKPRGAGNALNPSESLQNHKAYIESCGGTLKSSPRNQKTMSLILGSKSLSNVSDDPSTRTLDMSQKSSTSSIGEKAKFDRLLETAEMLKPRESPQVGSATEYVSRLKRQESIKNNRTLNEAIDKEAEARKKGQLGPASGMAKVKRVPSSLIMQSGEIIEPKMVSELADARLHRINNERASVKKLVIEEELEAEVPNPKCRPYTKDVWTQDRDLIRLQHRRTEAFINSWNNAFSLYIHGQWEEAEQLLFDTYSISNQQDGPTKFLLKVIAEANGVAPLDWNGYRIVD